MAGTTKRVATVVWSISIAVVLLVLTTSVMLPSTKRARISFDEDERAAATQSESRPLHIPSSKSNNFDFDGNNVVYAPASQPFISSSKSAVFRIEPPTSTTKPSEAPTALPTRGEVSITLDKQPVTSPVDDHPASRMHMGSSKSLVFPLKPPTTTPTTNPDR